MAKTYNTIPAVDPGDVYAATAHNDIVTNVNNYREPPMVRCTVTGSQSISTGGAGPTVIQFGGTDAFDTDSMHDPASNNTRIFANTAGVYVVVASVFLNAQTASRVQFEIQKLTTGGAFSSIETQEDSISFGLNVSAIVDLAVGESVRCALFHSTGESRTIAARSFFSAAWLGQVS